MATSATPVQLVDPTTGTPYSSSPPADRPTVGNQQNQLITEQQIRDNQTNGTQVTKISGTASIATGQVAVGTTSTLVVAGRALRQKVTLSPTSSVVYYVGNNGVTTSNGLYVAAGGVLTLDTTAAVYAIGASALTVSFVEYF